MSNNVFQGTITINVPARKAADKGQQAALKNAFEAGDLPLSVQSSCTMALAMNDALVDGIDVNGKHYDLYPTHKSRFGKTRDTNRAFAATTLIDDDGVTCTLHWPESAISEEMILTAIKHDLGKRESSKTFHLDLSAANVERRTEDQRKSRARRTPEQMRERRRTYAAAKPSERRAKASRPCMSDLERIRQERNS